MKAAGVELLEVDNRVLASDGGMFTTQTVEPPEDPQHRLRIRILFYEQKVKLLEEGFVRFEDGMALQVAYFRKNLGPAPSDGDFERLAELREHIEATRRKIEKLQSEVVLTFNEKVAAGREEEKKRRIEQADELRDRLRMLKL